MFGCNNDRDVDAQGTLKIVGRGLFIWAGMSCLIRVRVVCVLLRPENLITFAQTTDSFQILYH